MGLLKAISRYLTQLYNLARLFEFVDLIICCVTLYIVSSVSTVMDDNENVILFLALDSQQIHTVLISIKISLISKIIILCLRILLSLIFFLHVHMQMKTRNDYSLFTDISSNKSDAVVNIDSVDTVIFHRDQSRDNIEMSPLSSNNSLYGLTLSQVIRRNNMEFSSSLDGCNTNEGSMNNSSTMNDPTLLPQSHNHQVAMNHSSEMIDPILIPHSDDALESFFLDTSGLDSQDYKSADWENNVTPAMWTNVENTDANIVGEDNVYGQGNIAQCSHDLNASNGYYIGPGDISLCSHDLNASNGSNGESIGLGNIADCSHALNASNVESIGRGNIAQCSDDLNASNGDYIGQGDVALSSHDLNGSNGESIGLGNIAQLSDDLNASNGESIGPGNIAQFSHYLNADTNNDAADTNNDAEDTTINTENLGKGCRIKRTNRRYPSSEYILS